MNSKTILGISLAAIFAVAITPVMAGVGPDPITPLKNTHLFMDDDSYKKILFSLDGKANTGNVFGGYAVVTDIGGGNLGAIAVTSHPRFYDSAVQDPPTEPPAVPSPFVIAQLCTETDTGCGDEWHVHLVNIAGDARCALGIAVGDLSFEEPNKRTKQVLRWISVNGLPFGDQSLTSAATGNPTTFHAGLPADIPDAIAPGVQYSTAFDLNAIVENGAIQGVCIGPLA